MIISYEIRFQNRSHYVTTETASQWKTLDQWKRQHQEALYSFLTPNLILFGEWSYSKHSIHYTRLPDYFLAFDMYLNNILFEFSFFLSSFFLLSFSFVLFFFFFFFFLTYRMYGGFREMSA
jgi:hypothetical protein